MDLPLKEYDTHILKECPYEEVMCPNFGCEKEVLRKDFQRHLIEDCSHKIQKCEKCFTLMKREEEHDCILSLRKRCEFIENNLKALKDYVKSEHVED